MEVKESAGTAAESEEESEESEENEEESESDEDEEESESEEESDEEDSKMETVQERIQVYSKCTILKIQLLSLSFIQEKKKKRFFFDFGDLVQYVSNLFHKATGSQPNKLSGFSRRRSHLTETLDRRNTFVQKCVYNLDLGYFMLHIYLIIISIFPHVWQNCLYTGED